MTGSTVGVFAHNESGKIIACLESIKHCDPEMRPHCYVLANGCTDDTCSKVSNYIKSNPWASLVEIALPDKANAWNVFVHEVSRHTATHYFVDGDVEVLPKSFSELDRALASNREARAAAAVPADCGFSSKEMAKHIISHKGLAGNLYALSGEFVERIRAKSVKLPVGFVRDDGLIGALAFWDLEPRSSWNTDRIAVCKEAMFKYKRLSVFSWHDLLLHHKRKIRYSIGQFENRMLHRLLKERGLEGIPVDVASLYNGEAGSLKLEWKGADTFYDVIALRRIRRC